LHTPFVGPKKGINILEKKDKKKEKKKAHTCRSQSHPSANVVPVDSMHIGEGRRDRIYRANSQFSINLSLQFGGV
jgi:hypothetical protein